MRKAALVVTWGLFAAWVAWLGWQSLRFGKFPVVSRAQLAAADLAVVAEIRSADGGLPNPAVLIKKVEWPAGADAPVGKEITVQDLQGAKGFDGPGEYLLLLNRRGSEFALTHLPRSPLMHPSNPRLIYPATDLVLRQVRDAPTPNPKP